VIARRPRPGPAGLAWRLGWPAGRRQGSWIAAPL